MDLLSIQTADTEQLDDVPEKRLSFDAGIHDRLTHYLFRYPAKFHPPVAKALITRYSHPGSTILDPFCGSGTILVEAAVGDRRAVGSDVDPLAVFVSQVKTHTYHMPALRRSVSDVLARLRRFSRSKSEYDERQFRDLTPQEGERETESESLPIPAIPNLLHWFRRYVVIDLARIEREIESSDVPITHREFLRLCFASIIRSASNADPVPVSGLEVTSYMKRKDALGRIIDPFTLFQRAASKALTDVEEFGEKASRPVDVRVFQADAVTIKSHVRRPVDLVITSPPYHNAVDYYRRHQLEMFWLGLTPSQCDRLNLLPKYIGRSRIPRGHTYLSNDICLGPVASAWESQMRATGQDRADAFKHYVVSMTRVFEQLSGVLKQGSLAILVVGQSRWNQSQIPTATLFAEIGAKWFDLADCLWYPIKNRYMSYSRRNGASIDREYLLVLRRRRHAP